MLPTPAGDLPPAAVHRRRNRRRLLIAGILFPIFAGVSLWTIGVFGGNVHAVEPGMAYRSATLTGLNYTGISARLAGNDLDSVLKRNKIGTVICLRGGSMGDDWYRQEVEACARDGVDHEDVPMSARELPPPQVLSRLITLFDHARYPLLFHCQAGADRTGFASTLYAVIHQNLPLDKAESEELTWRYGHIPVDKTRAMDRFFDLYRREPDGLSLREWIRLKYPNIYTQRAKAGAHSD